MNRLRPIATVIAAALVVLGATACTVQRQRGSSAHRAGHRAVPAKPSGWYARYAADFWDSPGDQCAGFMQGVMDAMQTPDPDGTPFDAKADVAAMAGHHYLEKGVSVQLLGHATRPCFHDSITLTRLRVVDTRSEINGKSGYVIQGTIARR